MHCVPLIVDPDSSPLCNLSMQDYKPEEDPAKFKSVKTGRGPLGPNWKVGPFLACPVWLWCISGGALGAKQNQSRGGGGAEGVVCQGYPRICH